MLQTAANTLENWRCAAYFSQPTQSTSVNRNMNQGDASCCKVQPGLKLALTSTQLPWLQMVKLVASAFATVTLHAAA